MTRPETQIVDYQRFFFSILDEFFVRATGVSAVDFSTTEAFPETVRRGAQKIGLRGAGAYLWIERELGELYSTQGKNVYGMARNLSGFRLVQGGSSRFLSSQLQSARGALLYADTVLIPDPIAPWLERDRKEERFRHVLLLQAAHALLQLKPLIDADLPYPALLVFPSWEKLLEDNDPHTQRGIDRLTADVFARFVDPGIETIDEAVEFARTQPDRFITRAEGSNLIVPPGGAIGATAANSIAQYDKEMETWRSPEWMEEFRRLSPAAKIFQLVIERLGPQFHLLENSEEMNAHPLISVEQQAHYFNLVSETNQSRLEKLGLLNRKSSALIEGIKSKRLNWLSEVPIDALVQIRKDNENTAFRKRLDGAIANLHDSAIADIDRVAANISLEIDLAIGDHNRHLADIGSNYVQKHIKTAGAGVVTAIGAFAPALAPYIGAAIPFAVAAKLGWDAWDHMVEKKKAAKSLMGVLAFARDRSS